MRTLFLAFGVALILSLSLAPSATSTHRPNHRPSPSTLSGLVQKNGPALSLDGKPFRFTGFNIYNANSRNNCWYSLGTGSGLDAALTTIGNGSEVFRSWFFQRLATTSGVRDWAAFDHTLSVAAAHNKKVVATLFDTGGTCDSGVWHYDDWFVSGYKSPYGQDLTSFRNYVSEIVNRYKGNNTIAIWQIGNEIESRNVDGSCGSTSAVQSFISDISGLIKSIDSSHLVNIGTIGSGQCATSTGTAYQDLHRISTIDICEYHDYGNNAQPMPGDQWNGFATRLQQCTDMGKPMFMGEAGIEHSVGLQQRADYFTAKVEAQFSAGSDGFLVWNWMNPGIVDGDQFVVTTNDPTIGVMSTHQPNSIG